MAMPVAGVGGDVVNQLAFRPEVHEKGIDLAVVVVVGEACAARDGASVKHRAGVSRDIGEMPLPRP